MSYVTEQQREAFAKHELTQIDKFPNGWWCKRPDCGFFATVVIDTPVGVFIAGDTRFEFRSHWGPQNPGNGAIWIPGYKIGWFGSTLSEDYLLEKTMRGSPSKRAQKSGNVAGWICAFQQRFAELWGSR